MLTPGAILTMPADAAHVAECLGEEPAIGLHVYGGDVLGVERSMWDPDTLEEHPLTWDHYEILAQEGIRSRQAAAELKHAFRARSTFRFRLRRRAMPMAETGKPAPAFRVVNQDGAPVGLEDFAGRNVLIWWYPKADTRG